jgi:ribosomal protein S18 acetylase RimI-like enzyme
VLADPAIEFAGAFSPAGTPLGYTHTRYHTSLWSPGLGGHLEDLFVVESARGAGLGRALLEFALDLACNRGARFVSLTTNENNTNARGLYSSAGFRLQQEPRYDDGREICFVHPLQDGEQEGAPK